MNACFAYRIDCSDLMLLLLVCELQLLLMKRGGQVIYMGPLGPRSHKLVEYFEVNESATVSRCRVNYLCIY